MSTAPTYTQRTAAGVRAELARQRKSLIELARLLGRNRNYISSRVNGHDPFDLDEIETIANWLNVPVTSFASEVTA